MRLQAMISYDAAGAMLYVIEIDEGKGRRVTPRHIKKLLKSDPRNARVQRITSREIKS
jgi:hypothetical protein